MRNEVVLLKPRSNYQLNKYILYKIRARTT